MLRQKILVPCRCVRLRGGDMEKEMCLGPGVVTETVLTVGMVTKTNAVGPGWM